MVVYTILWCCGWRGGFAIVVEDLWRIRQRAQPTAISAVVVVAFKRCGACNNILIIIFYNLVQ